MDIKNSDPLGLKIQKEPRTIGKANAVLLVDDELMPRALAERMLVELGFSTIEAKDGLEAVEVFQQHKDQICCVLCDVYMPRMDGWKTVSILRRLKPGIPVILCSCSDCTKVIEEDSAKSPQVFLGKPFGVVKLDWAINQAMKRRKDGAF